MNPRAKDGGEMAVVATDHNFCQTDDDAAYHRAGHGIQTT